MQESSTQDYRNKVVINQRGGSIEVNNSTDREEIKLSQYSGSNISINNVVTSELATNNKQTTVIYDEFRTVGNTNSLYVEKDNVIRTGGNTYDLKGHTTKEQIDLHKSWREEYLPIAIANSQFNILRGTNGTRAENPDTSYRNSRFVVAESFPGYTKVPEVNTLNVDEVTNYVPVPPVKGLRREKTAEPSDITEAFGEDTGTSAPGVIKYGPTTSSSTQDGFWAVNPDKEDLVDKMVEMQKSLTAIEQGLGNGGDEIVTVKRHSIETVGAVVNNYPSFRYDNEGRSVVTEIGVSSTSVFKHFGALPVVEDVDNASNFPCGTKTLTVGNKYNVIVGSGGVQIKTSGPMVFSGTTVKVAGTTVNIASEGGTTINSSTCVDIFSNNVMIRSPRQILLDSSVGVANNMIVSGGVFIEGETYVNHISAPTEVQRTYDTKVFGQLVAGALIGVVDSETGYVYALATDNSVELPPHSHHFNNIPLTLYGSNAKLRTAALDNKINKIDRYERSEAAGIVNQFKAAL
jgi:hypothetical protein